MSRKGPEALEAFRGGMGDARPNARTLAASADNPGCNSRRVLDAARVNKADLASALGRPAPAEQSPFAIQRGNSFERRVKAERYRNLIERLRAAGFEVDSDRVLPLRDRYKISGKNTDQMLAKRAEETRCALVDMARGVPEAYSLIDGGALEWDYGGVIARLEADGIAWRIGGRIHVVEVKSFPIVDDRADPEKVGAAARQAAVYVAALRDLLRQEGVAPEAVSTKVLLVCPRNTSLTATMKVIDVERQTRSLLRLLSTRESIDDLLAKMGTNVSLDTSGMDDEAAKRHLARVLEMLGTNYLPSCLSSCPLAFHCREHARAGGDPGCLGMDVRASLGPVKALPRVIALAKGAKPTPEEADAAAMLVRAQQLVTNAGRGAA